MLESDRSWISTSTWSRSGLRQQTTEVPVMSATVLGLEMLLQEPCIDLRVASELVLSDVGATITILRLIGKEYGYATEHLCRMGDCLAGLDAGTWFGAISTHTFPGDEEHAATTALWRHSRLVAQYAQLVAESLDGVLPEEAYLVGLLHEIGTIPHVLGWPKNGTLIEDSLPLFIGSAIRGIKDPSCSSGWRFILKAAHDLAGDKADCAPRVAGWPSLAHANACVFSGI